MGQVEGGTDVEWEDVVGRESRVFTGREGRLQRWREVHVFLL